MTRDEELQAIKDLKVHESIKLFEEINGNESEFMKAEILRVPDGWLYSWNGTVTFVPEKGGM